MIAWVLVPPDAWPRWSRGLGAGGQCSPSGPAGPVSPRRAVDGQQYLQHQLSSSLPAANHFHLLLQSLGHTTPGLQQAHQLFPVHPVLRLRLLQQPRCILQRRRGCRFLRGCENRAREPGDGLATFKETDRLAVLDLMRQQQPGAAGRDWDLPSAPCAPPTNPPASSRTCHTAPQPYTVDCRWSSTRACTASNFPLWLRAYKTRPSTHIIRSTLYRKPQNVDTDSTAQRG
mmetsp:Transcript_90785/g.207781  ORF Transcript_90785/g.207781 Transcript_90785/m.207781 type:complete len:230 (+) Transcript_90785:166-855(+)